MIGNDVVDLKLSRVESNWQRNGMFAKLCTQHEQQLIRTSANPEILFWSFWSKKEAVYKIIARLEGIRKFIPLQIECCSTDDVSEVRYSDQYYKVKTEVSSEFIHSVAVCSFVDIEHITELQNTTSIIKKYALPYVLEDGFLEPISISHHGRFKKIVRLKRL